MEPQKPITNNQDIVLALNNIQRVLDTSNITTRRFKVGVIAGATLGSTGIKAITGLGFSPRLVKFTVIPTSSATNNTQGCGAMTADNQFYTATHASAGGFSRVSSSAGCIAWVGAATTVASLVAAYSSMDSDGFSINVSTASATFDVAYEAYA